MVLRASVPIKFAALAMGILILSCGVLAAPTVVSKTPNQLYNVPTNAAIGVRFSEAMDPVTIKYGDPGTVRLHLKTAGSLSKPIQARLELTKSQGTDGTVHVVGFHLFPTGGHLANCDQYLVSIKGGPDGVKSEAGVPMAETLVWAWNTTSWTLANGHFELGLLNWRAIHRPAPETPPGIITVEAVKGETNTAHPHVVSARRGAAGTPGMAGIEQGLADLVSPADIITGITLSAQVLRLADPANGGIRMEVEAMRFLPTGPVHRTWSHAFFPPLPSPTTNIQPPAWTFISSPNLVQALELHPGDRIETVRIFAHGTEFHALIDSVRLGPTPTPIVVPPPAPGPGPIRG